MWSIGSVSYLTPFASHARAGGASQPDDERQDFREHLTASAAAALADQRFPAAGIPHEIAETCARGGSEGEPRLRYEDVMARYGSDKPDLRYGLEIVDVTPLAKQTTFKVFLDVAEK